MTERSSRWRDLGTRVASAIVMIALTLAALWAGPVIWVIFVFVVYCIMIWELAPLCDPGLSTARRWALAPLPLMFPVVTLAVPILSGVEIFGPVVEGTRPWGLFDAGYITGMVGLMAPVVAGMALLGAGRLLWIAYGSMLAAAALFLCYAYGEHGVAGLVTLVSIVVISDTAGYFAGRALGGPKFWPAISPKKTWSGTVAGWIGAGVFGLIVLPLFGVPLLVSGLVAVIICFAAQLGDIAESAIKRHAGVKDASALIPGHGGVLDRLDALVAAAFLAGLITLGTGG